MFEWEYPQAWSMAHLSGLGVSPAEALQQCETDAIATSQLYFTFPAAASPLFYSAPLGEKSRGNLMMLLRSVETGRLRRVSIETDCR
jgi:hypothetical protein